MIDTSVKLTILNKEQVWGYGQELSVNENKQLDIFKKYGTMMAITDLSLLTGGYYNGFADKDYVGNFEETELSNYLNTYMLRDLFQSTILKDELEFKSQIKNIHNPYKDENILRRKNR